MTSVNTEIVAGVRKKEKEVELQKIKPRDVFRFRSSSYSRSMENDDGELFFHVLGLSKDGQIEVISVDFKNRRKLAKETLVIPHDSELQIFPNK